MKHQILAILVTILFVNLANSQSSSTSTASSRYYDHENSWSFGIGLNVVNDSGEGFKGVFNIKDNWNFKNPFVLNAEYYINNKISIATSMSFNKYKAGKVKDGGIIASGFEASYFAIDFSGKYSFRDILKFNAFDPYAFVGLGYTKKGEYKTNGSDNLIPESDDMTANLGFGANYWLSKNWGLNINFAGKFWALDHRFKNHTQLGFGVNYLFAK